VDLVRGDLTKLQRATLGALVVMDVHARDVVTDLAAQGITSDRDFEWQAQLRSYWAEDKSGDRGHTVDMHMMSATLEFGCTDFWPARCISHATCLSRPPPHLVLPKLRQPPATGVCDPPAPRPQPWRLALFECHSSSPS